MIKKAHFKSYKKLVDIDLEFKPGINMIAGNNGTCKSSILHVISNTYKKPSSKSEFIDDLNCISIITQINKHVVPKIETLNRKSQSDKDPSNGISGPVYSIEFTDGKIQNFRTHNSKKYNRYGIKPHYRKNTNETLREAIVIYLSLDRLYPFGEFQLDDQINKISKKLPQKYLINIEDQFENFTGHNIQFTSVDKMGFIKNRMNFTSTNENIDSNTVSSGEDNLLIMLISLYSLVYYIDSLKENFKNKPAYLLIDEFDASLHPEFQLKYLTLVKEISNNYPGIFLVGTTHSLTTIEESIKKKYNLIYLINRGNSVAKMIEPDMKKITANLQNALHRDLYKDIKIPLISEDSQARVFLDKLFNHFEKSYTNFTKVRRYFSIVDASFSSEAIRILFKRSNIARRNLPAIAILDGDQTISKPDVNDNITALPGNMSPERLIYKICKDLKNDKSDQVDVFWNNVEDDLGFTYDFMTKNIIPRFENLDLKLETMKTNGTSTKGIYREESKKIFEDFNYESEKLFEYWISLEENKSEVDKYYNNFKIAFYKVCEYHGLPTSVWKK